MSKPLRRLQQEGGWFARAKETRLLWVQADGSSRRAALTFVEKLEYHADNTSPFVVLDAPWAGADGGGLARVTRFVELFAAKRAGLVQAGIDVGEFRATEPADGRLDTFGEVLRRAHAALLPPLAGLVIVLAPPRVEAAEGFAADVRALIHAAPLAAVRWIVIEADSQHLAGLVEELGARALGVDVRVAPEDQRSDLAALAGPPPAPGAPLVKPHPWGAWSSGGAMPAVAAPRRVDEPLAPSDAQLERAGLSPLYLQGGAQRIKSLVVGASLALGEGRFDAAIELSARAAALFGEMNMPADQVTALLVLGGHELAASRPEDARRSYESAARLAESKGLAEPQAQAELALGMLDALEEHPSALGHYEAAATLSEAAASVPLAIECWRMAGQAAEGLSLREQATQDYQRALDLAERLPPEAARATSAAEVARLLARIVEQRGEAARAAELARLAFRLEHGVEPGPLRDEPLLEGTT